MKDVGVFGREWDWFWTKHGVGFGGLLREVGNRVPWENNVVAKRNLNS